MIVSTAYNFPTPELATSEQSVNTNETCVSDDQTLKMEESPSTEEGDL